MLIMPLSQTAVGSVSGAADAIVGTGIAAVTVAIVFVVVLVIGFVMLVRRGRSQSAIGAAGSTLPDLDRRANIALVRLDDAVARAAEDLGFAVAQFGEERAQGLASAVREARASLAQAFALRQRLDDSVPDTATQHREWNGKILNLCESAGQRLAVERGVFDRLRLVERSAPDDLATAQRAIQTARGRLPGASARLTTLSDTFAPTAVAPIAGNVTEAGRLLDAAEREAASAASGLDDRGVSAVSAAVQAAERDALRATALLDEVEQHAGALIDSTARLRTLVDGARGVVAGARPTRDDPPDPATGARVAEAIQRVENTIDAVRTATGPRDPDASIAALEAALDALDSALAGARNQRQRLSHARTALAGALLTARSQIETTRSYMGSRRTNVGMDARTRLAEAERLLAIAEAEADPVVALDTARSSATYSRDADALARYDLLH